MTLPALPRTSLFFALITCAAAPLYGAAGGECVYRAVSSSTQWQGPLDRTISLRAGEVSLEIALARLAAESGVRVSYSGDQLPLKKLVCASYKGSIGDVLAALLSGVNVQAVVAAADHIVLSPSQSRLTAIERADPVYPLEAVVVTASAEEYPTQQTGVAFNRIMQRDIEQHGSVAAAINANAPGVWVWHTPIGFTSHYSSRGASSFSSTAPKVYIDGIEVANPMLVTQLQPENIERIEVIRGPQGGALYGGDAISGVTNIITRHQTLADGMPRLRVSSNLALSTSDFVSNAGIGQDHNLSLRMGSPTRSGAFNLALGNVGEYMPGSFSRHLSLDGNGRMVGERTLITGTARYFFQNAGNPSSLLTDSLPYRGSMLGMQQYTAGARVHLRQSDRITHSLVLGVDGYSLSGVPRDSTSLVSVADSVLRAAGDGALRTTLRLSSALQLPSATRNSVTVSVAAEHSNLEHYGDLAATDALPNRSSLGFALQMEASFFERLSITSGLRVQRDALNAITAINTLPMLAGSYVFGSRNVNVRLRSAYGKAIRWPSLLAPEQQAGLEVGVDLSITDAFGIQVTRYDQEASDLMQGVALPDTAPVTGKRVARGRYVLHNVGEIDNRGWELQAFARRGPLSVSAGLSFTDSRVENLASGYAGDLREGDRMLAVPARTASLQAMYGGNVWTASVSAARAFDWINYDRLALLDAESEPSGAALRNYWRGYNGFTHLRANVTRAAGRNLTLVLSADNLLGGQTGEPDNLTVVPGRTISFGVKANF